MNCKEFVEVSKKNVYIIKKMRKYDHKYEARKNLLSKS